MPVGCLHGCMAMDAWAGAGTRLTYLACYKLGAAQGQGHGHDGFGPAQTAIALGWCSLGYDAGPCTSQLQPEASQPVNFCCMIVLCSGLGS